MDEKSAPTTRIDKWLWATRLFKSRSLAAEACRRGRVRIDGRAAKPAHFVRSGDQITFSRRSAKQTIRVERIIDRRVGSPEAVACYSDLTPPARDVAGSDIAPRDFPRRKPDKRERRQIERLRRLWREMDRTGDERE